jgi:CheY-like chemotaxis protein
MRRTILLADDSHTIQRLVTQTFADADFEVVSVSNGEAAIRKFEDLRPHVVLADIYMPGKNGYEVCAFVRSHAQLGATPVILLAGAFDAFDEETAKRVGANASITKPFEPGALVELVESVMQPAEHASATAPDDATENPAIPAESDEEDLLGLKVVFEHRAPAAAAPTDEDLARIVDMVTHKVSKQVIENIAWDVVPDIVEKVLREELKKGS